MQRVNKDNLLSNAIYKIYNQESEKFLDQQLKNINVSDLILLKEGQYAPADILVLDSGTGKLEKKIFKSSHDRLMGSQDMVRYAMTKFLSMEKDGVYTNSSQKVKSQIQRLSAVFQYKNPQTCVFQDEDSSMKPEIREIIGTLKLSNDPQLDLIKDENMIYFGSQLNSS